MSTTFTIVIDGNNTTLRVQADIGTDPATALRAGISAMQAELGDLASCPFHKGLSAAAIKRLQVARRNFYTGLMRGEEKSRDWVNGIRVEDFDALLRLAGLISTPGVTTEVPRG